MSDLMSFWPIIAFVVAVLALPAAGWAIRMGLASKTDLATAKGEREDDMKELEGRLDQKFAGLTKAQIELSDRTLRMESEIRHLPSAEDISDIKERLARADSRWDGFDREMQSITRALARVEDRLSKGATP